MPPVTPDQIARRAYKSQPIKVTLSQNNAVLSGTLTAGLVYSVTTTADVFFRSGTASVAAVNDDNPLWSRERVEIAGESTADTRVSFYTAAASGTAYLTAME